MVIKITPLLALEPYNAAEAASFKTSTDSIVEGSISAKVFVPVTGEVKECTGTPSMIYKGVPSVWDSDNNEL